MDIANLSIKAYSNFFQTTTGISNRVLESLPANLMAELRGLVGEEAAFYEPVVHSMRRLDLKRQLGKPKTKDDKEDSRSHLDDDWDKWSFDTVSITHLIPLDEYR